MLKYIFKRLLALIPIMLVMSMLVFGLTSLASGDPARVLAEKIYEHPTQTEIDTVRHEQGMDQPIYRQYIRWLSKVVKGDLGTSYQTDQPVYKELAKHLPDTVKLAVTAFILLIIVAVPLGVLSAIFEHTVLDRILQLFSFFSVSMPTFWLGLILLYLFGVKWRIIPVLGGASGIPVIPAVTLDIGFCGILIRMVRTNLSEVLKKDYIRTCRAKGLSPASIILKHGMKNAMLPVITQMGNMCVLLFCGSAVAESIFSVSGLGKMALEAVYAKDIPVLQGFILMVTCLVVLINLLLDIFYSLLDARIKIK